MDASDPFLLPLKLAHTLPQAGGKATSLARLMSADVPVPDGFVVTTRTYDHFVECNGLQAIVRQQFEAHSHLTSDAAQLMASRLRLRFEAANIPQEIADVVSSAYQTLGSPRVAIRSSATCEDLPSTSFAGQHDSHLNIGAPESLLVAIRKCWASLWTQRAILYRHRMRLESDAIKMAVVVQAMVPAEVSGVLFTAHPTTGDRFEMVVNASYGLGEAIVSGEVTPDNFVIDRETMRVTDSRLGTKATMIVPSDGGTGQQKVTSHRQAQLCLDARTTCRIGTVRETHPRILWRRPSGH